MEKMRPLGIKALSILTFFGGLFILLLILQTKGAPNSYPSEMPPWQFIWISFLIIGVLDLFSGIGLWLGKKWGWWVASFNFSYSIARSLNALYLLAISDVSDEVATKQSIKFGVRFLISALILAYLFRGRILTYFGLENRSKMFLMLTLVLPLIIVFCVGTLLYSI